jgi:hypothetical protein
MLSGGLIHVVTMQYQYWHNTKQESGIKLVYDIEEKTSANNKSQNQQPTMFFGKTGDTFGYDACW